MWDLQRCTVLTTYHEKGAHIVFNGMYLMSILSWLNIYAHIILRFFISFSSSMSHILANTKSIDDVLKVIMS